MLILFFFNSETDVFHQIFYYPIMYSPDNDCLHFQHLSVFCFFFIQTDLI